MMLLGGWHFKDWMRNRSHSLMFLIRVLALGLQACLLLRTGMFNVDIVMQARYVETPTASHLLGKLL